ncbi:HDR107Cp [Eremothecium sinecaudum]|uniref:HDR107Cp n=1 Tax=Eremothecium sinecaudum TaxID=45286 RepID=A0A0X8HSV5_9SACH|nr:HDR107Cp [Eremothecium sinecaudum]AMD20849.1 HDR107Cp [Eremothecium sinecaudum]
MTGTFLSKLDVALQALNPLSNGKSKSIVNLHISDQTKDRDPSLVNGDYSNTLLLSNGDHLAYFFSNDYTVLSLYPLSDAITGKTLIIHLPHSPFNQHYTFTIHEVNQEIVIGLILKTGLFLNFQFSLDYVLNRITSIPKKWYTVLNPYDFTVRVPNYLYRADENLSIVFLRDGGLLGLQKVNVNESGDYDLHPVLFNDNSYFQSFTKFFSKSDNSDLVVNCIIYQERFLVTLTENCKIRVWDLRARSIVMQLDLINDAQNKHRKYDSMGPYLSLLGDLLMVFLPVGNGAFQLFELGIDSGGLIAVTTKTKHPVPTNLLASSIWSLVDIKLVKPLELGLESSSIQLVVLLKSNTSIKLQILNFIDDSLNNYEWIETSNKSLQDLLKEQDLLTDGHTNKALLNLQSHYTPALYNNAQQMLSANGIIFSADQPNNQEYLTNLESILKDLKKHYDEPSSLSLYQGEIIVVNTLHLYNHSVYKINSNLESIYYDLADETSLNTNSDQLSTFLEVVDGFVSTISFDIVQKIGDQLRGIMVHEFDDKMPLKDKFTAIFRNCLEHQFQASNLKKLFSELTSLDVVSILNNLIQNHLIASQGSSPFIDSVDFNNFVSVTILESVHQRILIENKFITDILLIFTLLDFDYTIFDKQLHFLLKTHYNHSLWLHLYNLDKSILVSEIFAATSKYGYGSIISNYSDLLHYTNRILNYISDLPVDRNPLLIASYKKWIINPKGGNGLNNRNSSLFLETLHSNFYIRDDPVHQFMIGLSYYQCGYYEDSYIFLSKLGDMDLERLPPCLQLLVNEPQHPWHNLLTSLQEKNKASAYYYQLSKLFSDVMSYSHALKAIKRSINLSGEQQLSEDFKMMQLTQYVDTLIIFSEFEEILDVLTLEQSTLNREVRAKYYSKLLSDQMHKDNFIATLFRLCSKSQNTLFLPMDDYFIIDQLLQSQLDTASWTTYKRLYCYRMLNHQERDAAQILYDYIVRANNVEMKENCYWLIINVLSSFSDPKDQWIINSASHGQILYLTDLKSEFKASASN